MELLSRRVELVLLILVHLVITLGLGVLRMLDKLLGLAVDVLARIAELLSLARLTLDVNVVMVRFLELLRLRRRVGVLIVRVAVGRERVCKVAVSHRRRRV